MARRSASEIRQRPRGAPSMPVNTKAVGKTYDPVLYAVGREKIREYARAVGEHGRSAGGQQDSRAEGDAGQVPDGSLRGRLGRLQPDPHRRGVRARGGPARADSARAVDDGPGGARSG